LVRQAHLWAWGRFLAIAAALSAASAQSPDRRLLEQYCFGCHNARLKTAGLSLESLDPGASNIAAHAEVWERVSRKLSSGQMPPAGLPRPDKPALNAFVRSLRTLSIGRLLFRRIPDGPRFTA